MKHHPEYGELFPEWRLFESARSAHNFLSKRKDLFDKLVKRFQETVDFLNPRLNSSVTLQNLVYCFNTVSSTLYDGFDPEDMDVLLLELADCCVPHLHMCV